MKMEKDGWEPLIEVEPSDNFICQYGGPFAKNLQLNRVVIEKFLSLSALDGPFVLRESLLKSGRTMPDINPDGSVTAKGWLRWGEKLRLPTRQPNTLFQVETEKKGGYTTAINGGLLLERLVDKTNLGVRELAEPFANEFNYYLRVGLRQALLKDKLTFTGDPFFTGRIHFTYLTYETIFDLFKQQTFDSINVFEIMYRLAFLTIYNVIAPEIIDQPYQRIKQGDSSPFGIIADLIYKYWLPRRRSAKNISQAILLPTFEFDRLIGAYAYLDYQTLKGISLVRLSPD